MTRVWMYVLDASKDPNSVCCVVPWRVDEKEIFFGPCKMGIRERLRKQHLRTDCHHRIIADDLFIVSVNGSNAERIRKVVSAGKVSEVMTFREADKRLRGDRFREMREHRLSPLHVRPVEEGGKFVGYERVSGEHAYREKDKPYDKWVYDLVSDPEGFEITPKEGQERLILRRAPTQDFDRDCCMLLANLFFAQGQGIQFDKQAVDILKEAQPDRPGIDAYAVFGLDAAGRVNGLRGNFLEMDGDLANRFVAWLNDRARRVAARQSGDGDGLAKIACRQRPRHPPRNHGIC
jgi:hypothetical protein